MNTILVSVIICTHNRCDMLADVLATLHTAVQTHGGPTEVLVVDNHSTDGTEVLVSDFAGRHPELDLRYIREEELGVSRARNTGIRESRGDLLCYLDDDVLVSEEWLRSIVAATELADGIGGIGGRIYLSFPNEHVPAWVDAKCRMMYSEHDMGDAPVVSTSVGFVGANMALTREAVRVVGEFNTELGRVGGLLLSGEESEYAERLRRKGFKIAYAPDALIQHRVHPGRLRIGWIWNRLFWQGVTVGRGRVNSALRTAGMCVTLLINIVLAPLYLLRPSRAVKPLCRVALALGYFCGYVRAMFGRSRWLS